MGKCTLRHVVRNPHVEVAKPSEFNSGTSPFQRPNPGLRTGASRPLQSCTLAWTWRLMTRVSLRVEGLTMTVTAATSSWLLAFLWQRTSSRGTNHRSCLGSTAYICTHFFHIVYTVTRTAARIWCSQPNLPEVSVVNVQVTQRWSHEFRQHQGF